MVLPPLARFPILTEDAELGVTAGDNAALPLTAAFVGVWALCTSVAALCAIVTSGAWYGPKGRAAALTAQPGHEHFWREAPCSRVEAVTAGFVVEDWLVVGASRVSCGIISNSGRMARV